MTRDELYDVMNTIVRVSTGVTATMIADDNHGSPSGTYCSIEPFNSTSQRGQANVKTATDLTTVKPQMIAEVSFNFYRTNAIQLANLLYQANKRPDVQSLMSVARIGWNRSSGVRNLTGRLADGNQEERAQISVFVMFEDSIEVTHNTITTVPFEIQDSNTDILTNGVVN